MEPLTLQLMQSGIVLPQKISRRSWYGNLVNLKDRCKSAKASGFVDLLTPIIMASQIANNGSGGRPTKSGRFTFRQRRSDEKAMAEMTTRKTPRY